MLEIDGSLAASGRDEFENLNFVRGISVSPGWSRAISELDESTMD
jgi:hypothetical protein